MSDTQLSARIQRLEDRESIRELVSRYSLAVDDHDFASLGRLWHPDAIYGWVGMPAQAEGATAIVALLEERIGPSGPSFHVNHDQIVEWHDHDADRASGLVFCHAEVSPGGQHYQYAIRYQDKHVRHEGRWMFAERRLAFFYFVQPSEYDGILVQKDRMRPGGIRNDAHWPAFG